MMDNVNEGSGEVDVRTVVRSIANDMVQKAPEPRRVREEDIYTRPTVSDFEERGTESQIAALYSALASARGSFGEVKRTREVEVRKDNRLLYKFRYAPMEVMLAATTAPLTANGLVLLMPFVTGNDQITKQLVILAHAHGGRLVFKFEFTPAGEEKQFGGQTTYLQRYCYRSVLVLAADGDMDEGHVHGDVAVEAQDAKRPTGPVSVRRPGPAERTLARERSDPRGDFVKAPGTPSSAKHATLLGDMLALAKKVGLNVRSQVALFVYDTVNGGTPFGIGDGPDFCAELTVEQLETCLETLNQRLIQQSQKVGAK